MDERVREAERAVDLGDLVAVQRLVIERQREEDPLAKLEGLVARARALYYADAHFTLGDVLAQLKRMKDEAEKARERGHPTEGYLWVQVHTGERPTRLYKFTEPEHVPAFREPGAGCSAPAMCGECGAEHLVAGRCILPAIEGEGLDRDALEVGWWRGTRSGSDEGIRHFALVAWDATLGIAAVEVRTGTSRQKVSSVFQVLKRKRSEANRPTDRAKLRAKLRRWMLERDPGRVVMTTRYAEGPDRGRTIPLWREHHLMGRRGAVL